MIEFHRIIDLYNLSENMYYNIMMMSTYLQVVSMRFYLLLGLRNSLQIDRAADGQIIKIPKEPSPLSTIIIFKHNYQ